MDDSNRHDAPATIIDETVLLRYLLNDDARRSAQAHKLILDGNVHVYTEAIVHTVAVLSDLYGVPHSLIGHVIELLMDDVLTDEEAAIRLAARFYADGRIDFDTCLTLARMALKGQRGLSFDPASARVLSRGR